MDSTNQNRLDIPVSERSEKNSDGQNTRSASLKSPALLALIFFISILLIGFGTYASLLDARFQGDKKVQAEERVAQMKAQILEDQKRIEEKRARALQQPAVTYPTNPQPQGVSLLSNDAPPGYCLGNGSLARFEDPEIQCCPGLQVINDYCTLPAGAQITQSPCIDSDGGENVDTWGTVSGGSYGIIGYNHGTFSDSCNPYSGKVVEYFCINSEFIQFTEITCQQGSVCRYGACVPSN